MTNIRIVECDFCGEDGRLEPLPSGKGYSEWLCLDCGRVHTEHYPEELKEE